MDWESILWTLGSTVVGVIIGGAVNAHFAKRSTQELRREAEKLRRLTLKLIQILDGANLIDVKEWDRETGEPSKWPVTVSLDSSSRIEAPTPRWKRMWRRVFGG